MKYLLTILLLTVTACSDQGEYYNTVSDTESETSSLEDSDSNTDTDTNSDFTDYTDSDTSDILDDLIGSADCLQGEIPEDSCIGEKLFEFTGDFTITNGECNFTFSVTECDNGCLESSIWEDYPHCHNGCDDIEECVTPPENECIAPGSLDLYRIYEEEGRCAYYTDGADYEESICVYDQATTHNEDCLIEE